MSEPGEDNAIYPTGTCFDDALELMNVLLQSVKDWPEPERTRFAENVVLVHAIVAPGEKQTAHAWVEHVESELVFFVGTWRGNPHVFQAPKKDYYRAHNVVDKTSYTYPMAIAENRVSGNYGPWLPEYLVLCGQDPELTMIEPIPLRRISE